MSLHHTDASGPIGYLLLGSNKYTITFIEHTSSHAKVYFVIALGKEIICQISDDYIAWVERFTSKKVRIIRCDHGSDYTSNLYTKNLCQQGISRQLTIRKTPHHNGVMERLHRTVANRVRSILHERKLPGKVWAEVWHAFIYVYNRSYHSSVDGIPLLLLDPDGHILDLSNLCTIGCIAYAHIPKKLRPTPRKLAATADVLVQRYIEGLAAVEPS